MRVVFILTNGIATRDQGGDVKSWVIVLGSLSPLISTGILVFPLLVKKTAQDLHFIPLNVVIENNKYPLRFFPDLNEGWHKALHYLAIGSGLVLGYITIIYHINTTDYSSAHTFQIILTTAGLVFTLAFLAPLFFDLEGEDVGKKRFLLYFEFLGLYAYLMLLIYISFLSGKLV